MLKNSTTTSIYYYRNDFIFHLSRICVEVVLVSHVVSWPVPGPELAGMIVGS